MFKNVLKKIIILLIPFFIINDIYADEALSLQFTYTFDDCFYVLSVNIPAVDGAIIKDNNVEFTVTKYDSNTSSGESVSFKSLSECFDGYLMSTDIFNIYGVTDYELSLSKFSSELMRDGGEKRIYELLKDDNTRELFRPILFRDKDGNIIIAGNYFKADNYNETSDLSNNLNENPEFIDKLFSGELTKNKKNANAELEDDNNIFEMLNIDTEKKSEYDGSTADSYDYNENGYASNTGGSCQGYSYNLRNLREKIAGEDGTGGVCSAKSLNTLQNVSSLFYLKNYFDRSLIEPECSDAIFGTNGYLSKVISANTYLNTIVIESKSYYKMDCLLMETEVLRGLSLLTVYQPILENTELSGCQLIGDEVIDFLEQLFNTLKILSTCLCIVLCIFDIYKMVVTKESDITKFRKVLVKRVIALVCVFLVPIIVDVITDYLNDKYLHDNPIKCADFFNE